MPAVAWDYGDAIQAVEFGEPRPLVNAVEIENVESLRLAMREGFNVMLGSGFSVLASDSMGRPLPVGPQLGDELRAEFDADPSGGLSLSQLYTVLSAKDREAADAYLRSRFTVANFDSRYLRLADLNVQGLFTTNIDDLPWQIWASSRARYLNDVVARGPLYGEQAAVDYFTLHGSVRDDTRPFRFTTTEIASSFSADPTLWQTLRMRLASLPTVFWGYSLQDAAALEALKRQKGGGSHDAWIVLRPGERNEALVEYFRALKFQIVFAETSDFLDFVVSEANQTEATRSAAVSEALQSYRVPTAAEVPQRPVSEFYSGAAPAWSDVFRLDVPRLGQFKTVENHLNGGQDVVITGIPASGKTALLMQLAAADVGPGPSLIPPTLTKEGAEHLLRALNGGSATVFVDQFCDDIDAFNTLHAAPNVRLVAADRDYNVGTVTHMLDRVELAFVSVSEISEFDMGTIRKALPTSIRSKYMVWPKTDAGAVSILDFNLANLRGASLMSRLERAVREFQGDGTTASEMLTLVCYVHSCGTVLSMDMAIAYWRDTFDDYLEVFELVDSVGRLMNEYEGDLREEEQDYFSARSRVVADAVMRATNSSVLRETLEKFHTNISTARICRFDVFRRRGYNHKVIGKAFPRTEDGVSFYDFLLTKDENPYLLQQKALLLSARGHFQDSFIAIDRAVAMSSFKNWRIEATHAELLFDANLHLAAESREARAEVDRAMELLRNCYLSDRRRALHAFSYAHRAIQYSDKFGDGRSRQYLEQSEEWLQTVQSDEPYMTTTKWRLRDVRKRLNSFG